MGAEGAVSIRVIVNSVGVATAPGGKTNRTDPVVEESVPPSGPMVPDIEVESFETGSERLLRLPELSTAATEYQTVPGRWVGSV